MDIEAIFERIQKLPRATSPDALSIDCLCANAFLGVRADGTPGLFFELTGEQLESTHRVTKALDLVVSARFLVSTSGKSEPTQRSGYLLVLRNAAQLWCFSVLVAEVCSALSRDTNCFNTESLVDRHVSSWIDFFARQGMSQEEAIGLWGELYLITQFTDVNRGVVTWVGPRGQLFDFVGSGVRLEVKTILLGGVAWFSLEQIAEKDTGYSVFVRALPDRVRGRSLDDLVKEISVGLEDRTEFVSSLARAGYAPGDHRDLRLSAEELQAIPNSAIPRPVCSDSRIKAVRYAVDADALSSSIVALQPLLTKLESQLRT